jgi:hypothetical protein
MRVALLALAPVAALGLAQSAQAYSFSPKSANFTAAGKTNLTKGSLTVPCTARFIGYTDKYGVGYVKAASYSGSSLCTWIKSTGLPWKVKAASATTATVYNVSVSASIFGTCGPSNVPGTVKNSQFIFNNVILKPNCKINGAVTTTPKVSIVSP